MTDIMDMFHDLYTKIDIFLQQNPNFILVLTVSTVFIVSISILCISFYLFS
jgi:hypothetical protein